MIALRKLLDANLGGAVARFDWRSFPQAARAAFHDLAFPPRCGACRRDLSSRPAPSLLCPECLGQITPVPWRACSRCGGRAPQLGEGVECITCQRETPAFDGVWTLGSYDGLLRRLVLRMKSDSSEALAASFACLMAERWGSDFQRDPFDAIAWVPSDPWRRWRRGADGPAALAQRLAARVRVPLAAGLLRKRLGIAAQKDLSRAARRQNVRGGLVCAGGYQLDSADIALVDDVLTTGATCHEAARALKRAGARRVVVLVVARAANSTL